jgi:hypothetical protein
VGVNAGEGHDVPMEVGLVGVAGLRRDHGGALPGGEAVGGVVEADELGGSLRGEADLGPEPRPQALAAPPDGRGHLLDAGRRPLRRPFDRSGHR